MWSDLTDLFLPAFWETLAMVGVSGGIGALFGVPLGVLLYLTTSGGVLSAPVFNRVAGLSSMPCARCRSSFCWSP